MVERMILLTEEGQRKLEDELERLRTEKRREIAQRLHEATEDGDLEENVAYEAAKEEQAFTEGRIRELESILARAQLVKPSDILGRVQIGSTVLVEGDEGTVERFTVVGAVESNPKLGFISYDSPMGAALLDRAPGDMVQVTAPAGELRYRVLQVH